MPNQRQTSKQQTQQSKRGAADSGKSVNQQSQSQSRQGRK
ncbi:hypothetical protein GCM10007860_23790 [Chitiniphilus shinanonensis]|uniref:Uncharacterized protein n=1 Tax=Chitiniphilus shinanonensis TaxID=553088 RepID=A0ABQ6BZT0_9NEIS|nr:hypothetical protein GCM10007860_23790 [Chitiniphilus shinanonensis]